jgi:hypothetical protein
VNSLQATGFESNILQINITIVLIIKYNILSVIKRSFIMESP